MIDIFNTISVICGALIFIVGSLALYQNPRAKSNQNFFLLAISIIIWMTTLHIGFRYAHKNIIELSNIFFRLSFASGIIFYMTLIEFIYNFPKRSLHLSKNFRNIIHIAGGFFALLTGTTPLIYDSVIVDNSGTLSDKLGTYYPLFILFSTSILLFACVLSYKKITKTKGLEKQKLKLSFIGLITFVLFATITNGILPVFDIYILQEEAALFSLLFLIPTFYSIYKHRFFHLSYSSLNLTRQFLLILNFWITTGAILMLLKNISDQVPLIISIPISSLSGLVSYIWISKKFPELVTASYQHFRRTLRKLQTKIYNCDDYMSLIREIKQSFCIRLNIDYAELYIIRTKKKNAGKIPIYCENSLTKTLRAYSKDIIVKDEIIFDPQIKSLRKKLKKLQASLLLPLYSEEELIGFFILGNSGKNRFYGKEEINLLLEFKKHLEVCFMNILLKHHLRKERNILKNAIQEKTQKLREEYNRTKNIIKKQSDYLSMAAHELKNPLNVLMLQLETSFENPDKQTKKDLEIMECSVNHLKKLTMNLFEAQQYDMDKIQLNIKKTKIIDLVQTCFENFQKQAKQKDIELTFHQDISNNTELPLDPTKISQVLNNILSNALKFTCKKEKIQISVRESPLNIHVSIIDKGKGIPTPEKVKIFEKFYQGERNKGIGMGLYLSKKIIQLHKGGIKVHDTHGGGATFVISLRKKVNL